MAVATQTMSHSVMDKGNNLGEPVKKKTTLNMHVVAPNKALYRGVSHHFAAVGAATAGLMLIADAPTPHSQLASSIYAACLTLMFAASAAFHRPNWNPKARMVAWRIDHAAIYCVIAATYTPICMLALPNSIGSSLLKQVWTGAGAGIGHSLFAPPKFFSKYLSALFYLSLGWIIAPHFPSVRDALDPMTSAMAVAGGVCYTVGALIFASGRPRGNPLVFGAHEIFHVFVVIAAAIHFIGIRMIVMNHGDSFLF